MAKLEMGILGGFSGRVGTVVGYHRRGAWFVRAYQPHIKDRKSAAQLEQRSRFKAMIQFASPATPVLRVGLKQLAAAQQITEGNAFLKINKQHFNSSPKFEEVQANGHFNSSPKLGEVDARSADGGVCTETSLMTHAPVAAAGGATPSSLEGEQDRRHLEGKQTHRHSSSSPKLGEVDARSADGGVCTETSLMTHAPVAAAGGATPSKLEGELKIAYPLLQFSKGSLPGIANPQYTVDEHGVLTMQWSAEGGNLTDRIHIYIYCPSAQTGIALQGERSQRHLQALLPEGFAPEGLHLWAFASNSSGNVSNTQYINPIAPSDENPDMVNAGAVHDGVPAAGLVADCERLAVMPGVAAAVGDG